ncbi:leucine-rich repeat flightless-interacting protein 1 isoform X5 [Sphaeramia orbicularis]|uniref:leucine-rich repeat flightless-interacting protein 1 isoform X5 n=1 Tax=Sphaeramia orbicularis TaxID=375764 RepID=UPI0011802572|nr:leucine-rich repeat flightless-interacting protein 1-like isoform X5 [Sphaeramia orbicularis]
MGTQGTGRKRATNKERTTAEDDALNLIAREAEARLAAKRAARAEAREIRMKELERQQKEIFQVQKKYYGLDPKLDDRVDSKWGDIEQWMEDSERYSRPSRIHMQDTSCHTPLLSDDDERMSVGSRGSVRVEDRDYLEKGSRAASALTAGTLTSLGGTSSRRGSGETAITVDAETSLREIKDALAEVEEKYRKAMVSNAQLDNEKNNLMYYVDTLKDSLMEMEELLSESRREYEEKVKEFEREKHAHSVLQFQFSEMKETLKQSEELLNEIRQLRMKQDGFNREISDLQETVEWKDKKIGALERQKEYTDAIRVERDELREEVVKLKDILKKHGIVLGPDLNINGDIGETDTDAPPSGDATTPTAQDSQTSPTEGNSMLGNTEETETRSSTKEEVEPQQHQEFPKKTKENHLNSDAVCNATDVSKLETSMEEQTEQQTFSIMESSIREKDVNVDMNEASVPDDKVTSPEENGSGTETFETENLEETTYPDIGEMETKMNETAQTCDNPSEGEGNQPDEVDSVKLNQTQSFPQQEITEGEIKESLPDESIPAVSKPEPQQEPKTLEERANEEAEEASNKSQPQGTSATGKKKKKKKRGKKKGGTNEDKTQEKAETEKYDSKTVKDIRSDPKDNGPATEPVTEGSVAETVKESKVDQVTKEESGHKNEEEKPVEAAETTLSYADVLKKDIESKETETVEAVAPTEAPHIENEQIRNAAVTDKEESLESEKIVVVEEVMPNETFNDNVEKAGSDIVTHKQDKEVTLETEKEAGPVTSPNQESYQMVSHPIDNSEGTENSSGFEKDSASCRDDPQRTADIPPDGDFKTETVDEHTSEQISNSPENPAETNSDPESCAAGSTDVGVESIGIDGATSTAQLPDNEITVGLQSSSPSEPSAVTDSDIDTHIDVPDETATSIDGANTEAETEQKSSSVTPSPEEDSEETLVETGQTEQNGELGEVENSGCSSVFLRLEERFDDENGPLETVNQGEIDNEESQTQCVDEIDESNAEVSLTTPVVDTAAAMKTSDSQVVAEVEPECSSQNVEDPEFKNAENDAETSVCYVVEQPEECSNDESEGNSVRMNQGTDKDDDEDGEEGQSFDFDDMEMEALLADSHPMNPLQEQAEEAEEAVPDEISELCQNNAEPQLQIQSNVPENNNEALPTDESTEAEALDKEPESVPQNEQTSVASAKAIPANVCEEQKNISEEEAGTAEDPRNIVEVLNVTVVENDNQAVSLPVEEGVDVIKQELQDKDSPNTSEMSSISEPALSGKDVKKNSKKGKSKGKEECKMS